MADLKINEPAGTLIGEDVASRISPLERPGTMMVGRDVKRGSSHRSQWRNLHTRTDFTRALSLVERCVAIRVHAANFGRRKAVGVKPDTRPNHYTRLLQWIISQQHTVVVIASKLARYFKRLSGGTFQRSSLLTSSYLCHLRNLQQSKKWQQGTLTRATAAALQVHEQGAASS